MKNKIIKGILFLGSVLFLIIALNSCTSDKEKIASDIQKADSAIAAEKANVAIDTVQIKAMKYIPDEITVHAGDTIVWINRDTIAHDVTEVNKKWASPTLAPNQSWKMAVTESANYYCTIHVGMKGKIIVNK